MADSYVKQNYCPIKFWGKSDVFLDIGFITNISYIKYIYWNYNGLSYTILNEWKT